MNGKYKAGGVKQFYEFTLEGPFKPYVRMTQKGKWVKPQAQEYLASKEALQWQFRQQMKGRFIIPRGISLGIDIRITPVSHRRDIDNEAKALLDAAQGIVFEDDRWVDFLLVFRDRGDRGDGSSVKMVVGFSAQNTS